MKLKTGKEEVSYLLKKVFEKYESQTGELVIRNTNRKNYEAIAKKLSEISNNLPHTTEKLKHDNYVIDNNPNPLDYPFRKYDITASQVKDASLGLVNNPRPFLIDACYIYIFNIGRKGFSLNPIDELLIKQDELSSNFQSEQQIIKNLTIYNEALEIEKRNFEQKAIKKNKKLIKIIYSIILISLIGGLLFAISLFNKKNEWNRLKKDLNILPYKPTKSEIDSVEGVWLCYTGSPQARTSDPNRFHLVVKNIVDIKYKNGYFTFNRYGANFNHIGYAQFEAPNLLSMHSHIKNNNETIESPRYSLMQLDKESPYISVISASWNFDVSDRNNIVGIREVYVKQGKGGKIEEVLNTIENASCKCKIVEWYQPNNTKLIFQLKNQYLESLSDTTLKKLLDEKSIILREPKEGVLLSNDTILKNKAYISEKNKF